MEAAAELGLMLELLLLVLVLELVVVLVATVDKCRTSTRSNLPLVLGADMVRLPGVGRGIGERAGKGVRKAICNAPNAERRAPLCPAMHGYAQLCTAMPSYAQLCTAMRSHLTQLLGPPACPFLLLLFAGRV
jgi:hypothetical protein